MCQMESKKTKLFCFVLFFLLSPLSDNINRKIAFLEIQLLLLSSFSVYLSIYPPTHPSSKHWKKAAALLSTFNCCGLSANLYIHRLKTQAIVYELLYFDVFEGAVERQLLKDFKNYKELHYVTIKSKTLICHFNQNTHVRPFVNPSVFAGYEMTKMGTKWPKRARNDLGMNFPLYSHFVPSWPRYEMTKMGTKWPE